MLSYDYTARVLQVRLPIWLPAQSPVQMNSLSCDTGLAHELPSQSKIQDNAFCLYLDCLMPGTVADQWSVEVRSLMLRSLSTWNFNFDVDTVYSVDADYIADTVHTYYTLHIADIVDAIFIVDIVDDVAVVNTVDIVDDANIVDAIFIVDVVDDVTIVDNVGSVSVIDIVDIAFSEDDIYIADNVYNPSALAE